MNTTNINCEVAENRESFIIEPPDEETAIAAN